MSFSRRLSAKVRLFYLLIGNNVVRPAYRVIQKSPITNIRQFYLKLRKKTIRGLISQGLFSLIRYCEPANLARLTKFGSVKILLPLHGIIKLSLIAPITLVAKVKTLTSGRTAKEEKKPPTNEIVLFVVQSDVHLGIWISLQRICEALQTRGLAVGLVSTKHEILAFGTKLSMIPISADLRPVNSSVFW